MLNKDYDFNRRQLFWKFNPKDSMIYVPRLPWEEVDLERGPFRGEFDSLWRTSLAYIAYGDKDLKSGILNCFRKFTMINYPDQYWYQASRASNRYGEDDVSRDQVILALSALKVRGNENEVVELAKHLPTRLSRRFKMNPGMIFWVKYLATRKKRWLNLYLIMNLVEHSLSITLTKILRSWVGATKPVPLPHDKNTVWPFKFGWKTEVYKAIGYPEYALHFSSWMLYSVDDQGWLSSLNKALMRWQMQDSNLLLRMLLDGKEVTNEEINQHQPTNTFMWQRRTDFPMNWVYNPDASMFIANNIETDILFTIKSMKQTKSTDI